MRTGQMQGSEGGSLLMWLAGLGAAIGLGQLLAADQKITLRLAVGRAVVSGGLAAAAAGTLAWLPELSFPAVLGIGAALSSLGTSGVERLLQRFAPRVLRP